MPRKESAQRPTLSREQVLQMMDELIAGYATVDFQQELHKAWEAAVGDPVEQGRVRQATCLKVQGPIIERYGFEPSRKGVAHSVAAFNQHVNPQAPWEEESVKYKCHLVGWLVNPAFQKADLDREKTLAQLGLPPSAPESVAQNGQEIEHLPDTYPLPFMHLVPERPVHFGGFMGGTARAPSAFLSLPAGVAEHLRPLMDYLRHDPEGPFAGMVDDWPAQNTEPLDRWGQWGFDVGAQGKEQMLKADWHSVHGWGSARRVFVPRFGDSINMRRAPPRILAFLEAFREVNQECWLYMQNALEELRNRKDSSKSQQWLADLICHVFRERGHFGAIEAQVWWGSESTPTRSHKDGATSLLHLAISLGGSRTVRIGTFEKPDSFGPSPWVYNRDDWARWQRFQHCDDSVPPGTSQIMKENNVWDDEAWKEEDLRKVAMSAGDIYLSAPFIFEHGVMYDRCTRADPIIALQCRTAFQFEKPAFRVNERRDKDMLAVTQVLAKCLRDIGDNGWLRLPTLHEVVRTEHSIKAHLELQLSAIAGGRFAPLFATPGGPQMGPPPGPPPAHGGEGIKPEEHEVPQRHDQTEVPQQKCEAEERSGAPGHDPSAAGKGEEEQQANEATRKLEAWLAAEDELEQQLAEVRRRAAEELQRVEARQSQAQQPRQQQPRPQPQKPRPLPQPQSQQPPQPQLPPAQQQQPLRHETEQDRSTRLLRKFGMDCPDVEVHMPDAQLWVAVGGVDTGGIVVRKEQDLNSEKLRTKLATGAMLEELEVVGNRLHYRRLKGEGPDFGWVTTVAAHTGKVLVERL